MGTGIAKYDGESSLAHMAIHGNLRQIFMVSINNLWQLPKYNFIKNI